VKQKIFPKTALFSVSNKKGLVPFAAFLEKNGTKIIASGGTARILKKNGIQVKKVSSITKFPEIFGGRVKTLSPQISGGILGQRDTDKQEAKDNKIMWIDMVVCNLYPFSEVSKNPDSSLEDKIENIDIGGPTMIRAAAKNYKWVSVVVDTQDFLSIKKELLTGGITEKLRFELSKKAFGHCADYDAKVFEVLSGKENEKKSVLRYGENPHQDAFVVDHGEVSTGLPQAKQIQGKALSYNNFLDGDAALLCLNEFKKESACVIVKHNSPCGVGVGKSIEAAYENSLKVDSLSAFGGVVALNKRCSTSLAKKLNKVFFEIIIAPSFDVGALSVFSKKKNLRVLKLAKYKPSSFSIKTISGGSLGQENDKSSLREGGLTFPTNKKPSSAQIASLLLAWKVVKHTKSNAIVVAKNNKIISISGGQTSRVDATNIAFEKTGIPRGCVVASDAFFPFKDSIEKMARHGVSSIVQPGGSIRDKEVIESCNKNKISMAFTGYRVFKH
jgi:phosphoribosylaminoimidazolecarboxamide formyltransferase/IMP cyclohydrolase